MKVVVTRGGQQVEATFYCSYGELPKAISERIASLPEIYHMAQNHPNPFNPGTTIRYDLPQASRVSLTVYDMMGRQVRSWELQQSAGYKRVVWDGKDQSGQTVPTGIYIYRLTAASIESGEPLRLSSGQAFVASRKMVLLK